MTDRSLRGALISPDSRFRSELRTMLGDVEPRVGIAVEISERFVDFREDVVRTLRQSKPDLLLVDLEQEPELGVKFIQFLAESQPGFRVMVGVKCSRMPNSLNTIDTALLAPPPCTDG